MSSINLDCFLFVDANYPDQIHEVTSTDVCIVGMVLGPNGRKTCLTSPIADFRRDANGKISHAITRNGTRYALGEELDANDDTGPIVWFKRGDKMKGKRVVRMTELGGR